MSYHNCVYIHIGLAKTTTSHLQVNIFPKIKNKNLIYNHKIFYEMIDLINLIDSNKIDSILENLFIFQWSLRKTFLKK